MPDVAESKAITFSLLRKPLYSIRRCLDKKKNQNLLKVVIVRKDCDHQIKEVKQSKIREENVQAVDEPHSICPAPRKFQGQLLVSSCRDGSPPHLLKPLMLSLSVNKMGLNLNIRQQLLLLLKFLSKYTAVKYFALDLVNLNQGWG